MTQYARPDSLVSNPGAWTPEPLYDVLDEAAPDDGDYITSDNGQGTYLCEVGLSDVTDPASSSGHIIKWRAQLYGTGTKSVYTRLYLYQAAALIATTGQQAESASVAQHEYTLSSGEADSISDYTALRLRIEAYLSGTGTRVCRVTWAVFEVPDAGGSYEQACTGSLTPAGAAVKKPHKAAGGSLVPAGVVLRAVAALQSGGIQPTGGLLAALGRLLAGTLAPAGVLVGTKAYFRQLAGGLTPAGGLVKSAVISAAGVLAPAGAFFRGIGKLLAGTLASAGAVIGSLGAGTTGTVNLSIRPRAAGLTLRARRGLAMALRPRAFNLDLSERGD